MTTFSPLNVAHWSSCVILALGATLAAAPSGTPASRADRLSLAPPGAIPHTGSPIVDPAIVHAMIGNDGRPMISGRDFGSVPRQHPDWSRPQAQIPRAMADAEHPDYYIYEGQPVAMKMDPSRLLVQMQPEVFEARGVARAAGVAASFARGLGHADWHMLDLERPMSGAAEMADGLIALGRRPEVDFAAPVFDNPEIEGGWLSVTRDIHVRVQPDFLHIAEAVLAHAAPGLTIVERDMAGLPGAYRLRSDATDGFAVLRAANRLALDPRFAWSEPEMIGTLELHEIPNDPGFDKSWGLHNVGQEGCCPDYDLNAPDAWDVANGDQTVRVLVMDVGIQQDHPDLNLNAGRDFTDGSANGFGDGSPVAACDRHGTAVAGCIAGRINNNLGTTGIAPDSRVVSARIGSTVANPCGITFAVFSNSWVANAINWAYGQGIQITNASFSVSSSSLISDAYDDTWFNGMMHFASAGNGGVWNVNFPANLSTVHAVAALDPNGTLTSFSNSGIGLAFSAPGIKIWTTDQTGSDGYATGDFSYVQGTSFSAPYVAGCAALVWSALPDYSSTAIEFWLQTTATDLGVAGYDTTYGWGMPQPRAALNGPGPFNNFCANAWPIFTPLFSPAPFDTTQATAFGDEPQEWCEAGNAGVSNSVWFAFFAPCDAVVDIDTNGSDYNAVVSLYAGACDFAFPIACDDDSGTGSAARLSAVPVSANTLYMIKVSDNDPAAGGGMLDFDFVFRQINDECGWAIPIGVGYTDFCTLGATASAGQPLCADVNTTMVGDVWFSHTATKSGELTIRACGNDDYDTQLAVYEGIIRDFCPRSGGGGAPVMACSDDAPGSCTPHAAELTVTVQAGIYYAIRVGAHEGPAGDGTVNLVYESCRADVTGPGGTPPDDLVGIDDFLAVLSQWGQTCPCTADVTGDNLVGIADFLAVLAAWGTCP